MDDAEKPSSPFEELTEHWVVQGSSVSAEGDAAKIDALLSAELIKLSATDGGWRTLYRHRLTGGLWELSYPQGEMHGGGPRRLRQLPLNAPEDWR
jgi:hypothetical protein